MSIACIIGLSNPGAEYADTRHNAGAWFVQRACESHHVTLKLDAKRYAQVGRLQSADEECRFAIPTGYMNESGKAVRALSQFYKFSSPALLIAHDDIDLAPGDIRLKLDGGHGGHNGLRDIFSHLGTKAFYRLRIGVGHPGHKDDVVNYVLKRPSRDDQQVINEAIEKAITVLPDILAGKIDKATRKLHTN